MGSTCSCERSCDTWSSMKSKLRYSAELRRKRRYCPCTNRRPRCLKIRRRIRNMEETCSCNHECCSRSPSPEGPDGNPLQRSQPVQNICRFTVDAYFA
ncbi:uncharacterized protein LOC116413263 [Galleria mellonella]|uniref:Uncharacterized protein LOC116413263 n=1 Tax=Galleria mellonella TaxID=7137 RepID=A0A6J3C5T4_GALME|nr:uncharacterized protein LOC116413263 [Galleria mellonella]